MNELDSLKQNKRLNVKILLSTYNGEQFLEKQLDSLINQDFFSYKVIVRDDGSSDKTIDILQYYKRKFPEKIEFFEINTGVNLGVKKSFELLMKSVEADYYFFCDQDDIWASDKISTLVNLIEDEKKTGLNDTPFLAFSDFRIIRNDEIVIESFFKKLRFKEEDLTNKVFTSVAPGCCFCFDQKAKELYFKYTTDFLHDSHLHILIQLFGKTVYSKKSLTSYRLHGNNTVGIAKKNGVILLIKDFLKFVWNRPQYRQLLLAEYDFTVSLLYEQIDNKFLKDCEMYLVKDLNNLSSLSCKKWYVKHFKPFDRGRFEGIMRILTF